MLSGMWVEKGRCVELWGFVYLERRGRFETYEAAWQKLLMPIFSTVTEAADIHSWTGW